jgi:hypothetical protein
MKSVLLSIALLSASAQTVVAQNVRIIRTTDRTTVSNPVIIPTPPRVVNKNDSASVSAKNNTPATTRSVAARAKSHV